MSYIQLCGAISVMVLILIIGVKSGEKVKNAEDFQTGGRKSSYSIVTGIILGTIVGGSCTIGTAQMAYSYGISAWWLTLSCGIGCLVIALFYIKPFRCSKAETLLGILGREYGTTVNLAGAVVYAVSTLISLVAQLISATAILPFIFNGITVIPSIILAVTLILVYVFFGGALGAGAMGKLKTIMLCIAALSGAAIILNTVGLSTMWNALDHTKYFNLFARGPEKELSKAFSIITGIVSSQVYMQAVRMAHSDDVAQRSEILCAILTPLIGLCGVFIGMFMRMQHPGLEQTKFVFPQFVLTYMPEWLGGIVMGTLLLALVGSAAGVILGASVSITKDIIQPSIHYANSPEKEVLINRLCILAFLLISSLLSTGILGDFILTFSTLGTGLRASAIFPPLTCTILFPGKVDRRYAMAGVIAGPLLVLLFTVWPVLPWDSLFVGILGNVFFCIIGAFVQRRKVRIN